MPKPNQARTKAVQAAEKRLLELSSKLQKEYYNTVWREISGGITTNKAGSIKNVTSNKIFVKAWKEIVGKGINYFFKEELNGIEGNSANYYEKFTPKSIDFDGIKKDVTAKLRSAMSGFMDAYSGSLNVANSTRGFVVGQIESGVSFADVRDNAEDFIIGSGGKLGVVDNFNLVQSRVQDTFAEYDRRLSNGYSTALDLNYFIYQGGEINTTRDFCEERNGNVYTREEGEEWNELVWEGKNTDVNNVLLTAGGYNCRHYFDCISYELAVQLRPDIQKSKYD